jgi:type IV secretory pathway VirB2 component (pilin)
MILRQIGELYALATVDMFELVIEMTRNLTVVPYVVVLIAVVVGMDLLFFRHQFWERLIANIGIVMVFAAFYLRFLKNP